CNCSYDRKNPYMVGSQSHESFLTALRGAPVADILLEISLEKTIKNGELQADLYVSLRSDKFVRIARAGSEESELERYKSKNVEKFFVNGKEYSKFFSAREDIAGIPAGSDEPVEIVEHSMQVVFAQLQELNLKSDNLDCGRGIMKTVARR